MIDSVLALEDLRVYYHTDAGPVKAVDGVSFSIGRGERFGLVGESGSGKSTTAWAIMRLIKPPGRIESGVIRIDDARVDGLPEEDFRRIRLAKLALVPQGAMYSLNPVVRIKDQIIDGLRAHPNGISSTSLNERLTDLVSAVGLPAHVLGLYPHELSGGMRQRYASPLQSPLDHRSSSPTSRQVLSMWWCSVRSCRHLALSSSVSALQSCWSGMTWA